MYYDYKPTIIAAVADNGAIGVNGTLPWNLPKDLKRFKERTIGSAVIMGRNTWESLPKKPLPQRLNIVVSNRLSQETKNSGDDKLNKGYAVVPSLEDALEISTKALLHPIIIGGKRLWEESLPIVQTMYLTKVHLYPMADVFFPELDDNAWKIMKLYDEYDSGAMITHYYYSRKA